MLTRQQFVEQYAQAAKEAASNTGIFPETILAAAILESSGKKNGIWYVGASQLASKANNYFGIKASKSWKGKIYNINTKEYVNGQYITVPAKFRAYDTVKDSFADYVSFLKNNSRYVKAGVFTAATASEQVNRIAAAGYATDPNYSKLLNSLLITIKKYLPAPSTIAIVLLVAGAIYLINR